MQTTVLQRQSLRACGLVLLLLFCGIGLSFGSNFSLLLNADALYIPALVQSLWQGQDPRLFAFPPSPYLFPDVVIYLPWIAIIPNAAYAGLVNALFQVTLFVFAAECLARRVLGPLNFKATVFILAPFVFFLFAEQQLDTPLFIFALISAHHFGVVILSLWCLGFVIADLKNPGTFRRAALLLITTLGSFSDPLFIAFFVLPILCVLLGTKRMRNSGGFDLGLRIALAAFTGAAIYLAFRNNFQFTTIAPNPGSRLHSMKLAARAIFKDASSNPFVIPAYFFGAGCSLVYLLKPNRRTSAQPESTRNIQIAASFLLWLIAASVAVPILLEFYRTGALRYLMPGAYFSVLIGQLVLVHFLQSEKEFLTWISCALIAAAVALLPYSKLTLPFGNALYPPLVECVDARLTKLHAKRGLADYWIAKQFTFFSKIGLHVDEVTDQFRPQYRLNNAQQYIDPATGGGWDYDFVVLRSLDLKNAKNILGPPDFSFWCPRSAVWVYRNPRRLKDLENEVTPASSR